MPPQSSGGAAFSPARQRGNFFPTQERAPSEKEYNGPPVYVRLEAPPPSAIEKELVLLDEEQRPEWFNVAAIMGGAGFIEKCLGTWQRASDLFDDPMAWLERMDKWYDLEGGMESSFLRKRQALQRLKGTTDPHELRVLCEFGLKNEIRHITQEAAEVLKGTSDPGTVGWICQKGVDLAYCDRVPVLAYIFAGTSHPETIQTLIEMLKVPYSRERQFALQALHGTKDPAAISALDTDGRNGRRVRGSPRQH